MRPTELKFRSPKEKTAEFRFPLVTNQGKQLFEVRSLKKKPDFPTGKRFRAYDEHAKLTGYRVGPGSYLQDHFSIEKSHIKGTHIYKDYYKNKDLTNNGYIFIGNQLMFDASFLLPSRKHPAQGVTHQHDLSEFNKPQNFLHMRNSTASNTPSRHDRGIFTRQQVMSPNFLEFNYSKMSC